MTPPRHDSGQAFPIYLTVVAGLLFLALAYLAVGQGAVNRSGAQTAADAAALAAAQNARAQLTDDWVRVLSDPKKWQDIFDGRAAIDDPCWRAGQLAAQNDARLSACRSPESLTFQVDVKTNKSVGRSVVPGTEDVRSTASATAVVDPLCIVDLPAGGAEGDALPRLSCDGGTTWDPDPHDPSGLPKPEDLFDVHLGRLTSER
ncbi:pilus assembly protein TadG-related protein [Streptomyces sp. NPDC028722]|uniref:pilus assembly protein TadG-related protein n=1 Tax=Streptomyces sp. NPDC028722 TaxID=3155016 RepID=UPI0033E1F364